MSQKLAGVTLHSEQSPLRGEALCGAMATFLLNGQWLKGAKEAVLDELHLMKLLHDWPTTDKDWKPVSNDMHWWDDPAGYLAQRLILLGVEESEDLELLAVEDLLPNVSEIVEVDPFAMEQLRRDFPRLWVLHGAIYQCDIRPRQGKVILSPANATAKKTKDPSSQLIPRFRGFQVDYRKASRVVSLRKR